MPIPKPNSDETQDAFIGRCMTALEDEFPDQDQRLAVCFQGWRDKGTTEAPKSAYKVYTDLIVKDLDEQERSEKSVITTECVDRDQEVVLSKGLDFAEFRKNPVVLFMHDPTKVVGRCTWVKPEKTGVIAKTEYATTPFAEEVWGLVKSGMLKGKSIGMDWPTVKRRDITPQEVRKNPDWAGAKTVVESAKIFEYSVVSLPANPEALTKAYDEGKIKLTEPYFPREKKARIVVPAGIVRVAPAVQPVRVIRRVKRLTVDEAVREAERAVKIARGAI